MARRSIASTIVAAGLIAGTLDILDPIVFYWLRAHVSPIRILQSVASGLLGKSAFTGGIQTALLGLALHFVIALCWAALFVLLARAIPALREHAAISGILYGAIIFLVMNLIVLPHTKAAVPHYSLNAIGTNAVCAVVFLVGLPIALVNRRLS